jgi:hypothetical protein
VIWLVGSSIVFVLPLILAALARLLFEDKSVLVPPADPCDHPCSDAAGTCDWRCPHLRSDA